MNGNKYLKTVEWLVLAVLFSLTGPVYIYAQISDSQAPAQEVHGLVTNEKGDALSDVSVLIMNSNGGTISNNYGKFVLTVENKQAIVFSHVGYTTKTIIYEGDSSINIRLMPIDTSLNDVVVIGYGTQKKSSLTSAISTIKGDDISMKPIPDLSNGLGGRMAGVIFTQGSGEPGNDRANILIRGISTTGGTGPLIIVDGVPRDFTRLDPHSIASISVLKDAAAVAPYGMAGANGVILVTTKQGQSGLPTLTYNGYVGWENPTVLTKFANAYQYATLFNAADDNEGVPRRYSDYDLQKFKDGTDPDGHPNHDVLDELTNHNTILTNHNLEISGGSQKVTYYAGLNYIYQAGLWGPTNLNQYNLIAKVGAQVSKTTKVDLSLTDRVEQHNYPAVSAANIMYQAYRTPPTSPVLFSNGLPGEHEGRNAWGDIYNSGYAKNRYYVSYNQISVEQQLPFIKGLSIKAVAAYDLLPTFTRNWTTPMPYYTVDTTQRPYVYNQSGVDGPIKPAYSEGYSEKQQFTYQGYVKYANAFGKSNISGLVVLESINSKSSSFSTGRNNYNVDIPELDDGSSDPSDLFNSGSSSETKQRSIVYRVTYDYASKYFVEASGRYDGNYYFAPSHRYGFFPAFSVGWRLSEEKFIKDNAPWVNNLKIRASYGESGALAGAAFQYLSSYNLYGNSAVINGKPTQGLFESSEPNPSITWERAKKSDVGIDASLWNGLLDIEADYFYEKRNNMLVSPQVTVPSEYGIGISQVNAGVMENQGVDFTIGTTQNFSSGLRMNLSGNFTYAKNKLLQVFETSSTYDNPNRRQTGRSLGTKFGYKALGYFTPNDFNADGTLKTGIATQPWGPVYPGDLRYQDTNGDGKIDASDNVPIGLSNIPEIIYGFNLKMSYKGFDLDVLFQGAADRDFYVSGEAAWPFASNASVPLTALDVWTIDNPNAASPRVTTAPSANNTQYSSWWLQHAGYLRLKSCEIGYTLPAQLLRHINIQSVRFYLSGQNLLTWSKVKNFDPEISDEQGFFYPQQRVLSAGLNVTF